MKKPVCAAVKKHVRDLRTGRLIMDPAIIVDQKTGKLTDFGEYADMDRKHTGMVVRAGLTAGHRVLSLSECPYACVRLRGLSPENAAWAVNGVAQASGRDFLDALLKGIDSPGGADAWATEKRSELPF